MILNSYFTNFHNVCEKPHDSVAKRKNRSVVEAARAMLEEKSMPKFYWAKAVRTAVYIQNWIGEKVSAHEVYL